ncbi:MAG: NAD(+) synthase [Clostridiales bacterium]|nr:NAD(+) synthase [Clostridiales bacterium]
MDNYGFVRVAAISPKIKVADVKYNTDEIMKVISKIAGENISAAVFPELCVTGYTCGDLFGQDLLIDAAEDAIGGICEFSKGSDTLLFVGAPVKVNQFLFNCAVVIQNGNILGIVPKTYLPNYSEFYEKRWFSSATEAACDEVNYCKRNAPFGTDIIFADKNFPEYCIGAEICEDLWAPVPPSSYTALSGATVLVNLSASNELVNKAAYREELVKQQSARLIGAYVYSSSGVHESTTDLVFSGHLLIAENGGILSESKRFERDSAKIESYVDIQKLSSERRKNLTFRDSAADNYKPVRKVLFTQNRDRVNSIDRFIDPHPFVPSDISTRDSRCREIFNIQVAGLAKRIEHTKDSRAVIGVSGGLDSTLALLVAVKTFDALGIGRDNIYTITMPGFGTTDRTYNNTVKLCNALKTNFKKIDIVNAALLHFKDIGHDPSVLDVTYENVQARERTQILMDIANKVKGLVIGTGDLSEIALGWSTYNGDHMSMYAVNCSIPKTLVRSLVKWVSENEMDEDSSHVLVDILNTPVSPELLPADKSGNISQKTEEIIGPYELHDFFLYHFLRYDAPPSKIIFLACNAFREKYTKEEIKKWLKCFYKRFFAMQFKRSCIPDGPKVGTISLSPRGDWRMPSDASVEVWLKEIEEQD